MDHVATRVPVIQIPMPGMPETPRRIASAALQNLWPGREVIYVGDVRGGPRSGARGVVKRTLGRRVEVDMGRSGTWHIPYHYMALPPATDESKPTPHAA